MVATIRDLWPADLSGAEALLEAGLGGRLQARRGELIDVLRDELELVLAP